VPDQTNYTPIQLAWSTFAASVHTLLVPQPDDRPLDQFLEFRDRVMGLVRSEAFVLGLVLPVREPVDAALQETDEALLAELRAFSRAAEVAAVAEPDSPDRKRWIGRQLGRAGTVAGSVKDLVHDLPPLVKSGLTLFKELMDVFK